MPEGPTIYLAASQLKHFENQHIVESGGYKNPYAEELNGKTLQSVSAYGKYFIFQFAGFFITIHLGLFGRMLIDGNKKVNPAYSLHFENGFVNFYVVNVKRIEGKATKHFNYSLDVFSSAYKPALAKKLLLEQEGDQHIGTALMEQEIFPGLGNIIRNELLYMSKIHPDSIVSAIPATRLNALIRHFRDYSHEVLTLIEKKKWKASTKVYKKEKAGKYKVEVKLDNKIKRKDYFVPEVQVLYEN